LLGGKSDGMVPTDLDAKVAPGKAVVGKRHDGPTCVQIPGENVVGAEIEAIQVGGAHTIIDAWEPGKPLPWDSWHRPAGPLWNGTDLVLVDHTTPRTKWKVGASAPLQRRQRSSLQLPLGSSVPGFAIQCLDFGEALPSSSATKSFCSNALGIQRDKMSKISEPPAVSRALNSLGRLSLF
jgi:hypothetical protein